MFVQETPPYRSNTTETANWVHLLQRQRLNNKQTYLNHQNLQTVNLIRKAKAHFLTSYTIHFETRTGAQHHRHVYLY